MSKQQKSYSKSRRESINHEYKIQDSYTMNDERRHNSIGHNQDQFHQVS